MASSEQKQAYKVLQKELFTYPATTFRQTPTGWRAQFSDKDTGYTVQVTLEYSSFVVVGLRPGFRGRYGINDIAKPKRSATFKQMVREIKGEFSNMQEELEYGSRYASVDRTYFVKVSQGIEKGLSRSGIEVKQVKPLLDGFSLLLRLRASWVPLKVTFSGDLGEGLSLREVKSSEQVLANGLEAELRRSGWDRIAPTMSNPAKVAYSFAAVLKLVFRDPMMKLAYGDADPNYLVFPTKIDAEKAIEIGGLDENKFNVVWEKDINGTGKSGARIQPRGRRVSLSVKGWRKETGMKIRGLERYGVVTLPGPWYPREVWGTELGNKLARHQKIYASQINVSHFRRWGNSEVPLNRASKRFDEVLEKVEENGDLILALTYSPYTDAEGYARDTVAMYLGPAFRFGNYLRCDIGGPIAWGLWGLEWDGDYGKLKAFKKKCLDKWALWVKKTMAREGTQKSSAKGISIEEFSSLTLNDYRVMLATARKVSFNPSFKQMSKVLEWARPFVKDYRKFVGVALWVLEDENAIYDSVDVDLVSGGVDAEDDDSLWESGQAGAVFKLKAEFFLDVVGNLLDYENQVRDMRAYKKALLKAFKDRKFRHVLAQIFKAKFKDYLSDNNWYFLQETLNNGGYISNFEWELPTDDWGDANAPGDFDIKEVDADFTARFVGKGLEVLADIEAELEHN